MLASNAVKSRRLSLCLRSVSGQRCLTFQAQQDDIFTAVPCGFEDLEYNSDSLSAFCFKAGKGDLASGEAGWTGLHKLHEMW